MGTQSALPSFDGRLHPAPADYLGYLRSRAEIELGGFGTEPLGPHLAHLVDYTVHPLPAPGEECYGIPDSQCFVPFMMTDRFPYTLEPGARARLYTLRDLSTPVGIFIDVGAGTGSDADLIVMYGLADRVLASLEVG